MTNDDNIITAKTALAHINEIPDYYKHASHRSSMLWIAIRYAIIIFLVVLIIAAAIYIGEPKYAAPIEYIKATGYEHIFRKLHVIK